MHRIDSIALIISVLLAASCVSHRASPALEVAEISTSKEAEPQSLSGPTASIEPDAAADTDFRAPAPRSCPPRIVKQIVPVPTDPSPSVAPSIVCHPTVILSQEEAPEPRELTWADFQSLIQLGVGMNLLFGLFQAALDPVIRAAAESRRNVLKALQADPGANVDAVKLSGASKTVTNCEKFARDFARIGAYPSVLGAVGGIVLLIVASEQANSPLPSWGRCAAYLVSLLWPIMTIVALALAFVRGDRAVRRVRIGK